MKSDSKDSNNITKYFCHINAVLFKFLFIKTLKCIIVKKCFFKQQIRMISEGPCDAEDWSNGS